MKKGIVAAYVILLGSTFTMQSCEDDPILPNDNTGNICDTTWVGDSTNSGGGNGTPDDSTWNGGGGDPVDSSDWNGGNNGNQGDSTGGNDNPNDTIGGN